MTLSSFDREPDQEQGMTAEKMSKRLTMEDQMSLWRRLSRFLFVIWRIMIGIGRFMVKIPALLAVGFRKLSEPKTWRMLGLKSRRLVNIFFANRSSTTGTIIMLIFVFVALFGRLIVPYNALTDETMKYLPPTAEHWLGTDNLGRDVFGQLIHGARDVLTIALLTSLITVVSGIVIGMLSGYMGGWIDRIIQMISNLFLSIPSFPVLLILASFFTIDDPLSFALVLSAWGWAGLGRAIRSQIISLKERDFIQVCKVMNLSRSHIIFRELMPNISSYILINFVMIMRDAITGSVGIMMLGLAAFQPSNWGAMLLRAKDAGALLIPEATYFLFAPIVAILLFQMGAILLANGLDETLNPRLRKN